MRPLFLFASLLLAASAWAQAPREPVVGLPCEGCEAVFIGMPAQIAARARIGPAAEPGAPMLVTGRVLDARGQGRAGVIVYAYQTNAQGLYPQRTGGRQADGMRHGALRAWARTDASGRYTFDTIRPGSYPDARIPEHIHMHVIEPGCATYYIDDIQFTDDPKLTPQLRRLAGNRGGNGIVTPVRRGGAWEVTRDIHLGRNIPGFVACAPPRGRA